jgi:beta-galactosidase
MRNFLIVTLMGIILAACSENTISTLEHPRETLFNDQWEFVRDVTYEQVLEESDFSWELVNLPHSAHIEPLVIEGRQWQGDAFYRKTFTLAPELTNKHLALHFEGAMQVAEVLVNGQKAAVNYSGYLPFYVNITQFVTPGTENTILVKLNNEDNPQVPPGKPIDELDFNLFSGIYRNVWLVVKDPLHLSDPIGADRVAAGGVMVSYSDVSKASAKLQVQADVENTSDVPANAVVKASLVDQEGKTIASRQSPASTIKGSEYQLFNLDFEVDNPQLWSPSSPYLYTVDVTVYKGDTLVDHTSERIGIKTFAFHKDGFELNGDTLYLRGTNRHQEYPYIGYALSDNANYRDAYKIREAGFNFVRLSHYPHSKSFLAACDELGLLVMDAIPGWQFFGDEVFAANALMDVRKMVRRDRNHASIILWEAALNETGMPDSFVTAAHNAVKEEYPSEDVYTCGWIEATYDVFIPARQHGKPPHYWNNYDKKPHFIAEYGDWEYYAHNAGFNQTAFEDLSSDERNSRQLRGFGQRRLAQQALNYQEAHNSNRKGQAAGDANWLMFDYNRGYAPDLEASGIMDIFRLPKFAYYFYKSQARIGEFSQEVFNQPFIQIANFYNDPGFREVKIYSNCEEIELLVNGASIGRQWPDSDVNSTHLVQPPFTFLLEGFTPGEITAKGYIDGMEVLSTTQKTPGEAAAIKIWIDESGRPLEAGKGDVVFLYAAIMDKNGTTLPEADHLVTFKVTGDAKIIGTNPARAEAGIATVLLQAGKESQVIVSAGSKDLPDNKITLQLK